MLSQVILDSLEFLPFLGWAVLGIVLVGIQTIFQNAQLSLWTSIVGLASLFIYSALNFDPAVSKTLYFGLAQLDGLSQFFNILGILTALAVILISTPSFTHPNNPIIQKSNDQFPEYLICIVLSGFGLAATVSAFDLSTFFLGIETLSIGLYALCGFYRFEARSTESALKYLFIGAFATCILLYGIAFIYGAAGSTSFVEIFRVIEAGDRSLIRLGSLFLVVGIGFKLALVPFHLYTPDVYEGAPTPITAYLATVVKIAAIGAAIRIFQGALAPVSQYWESMWLGLCVLSVIFGNLAALQQKTLKKLLAFSSVSHAGFLGLGLYLASPGMGSLYPLLSYLVIYTAMSLGIFGVIAWIENRDQIFFVEDLKGLGMRRPLVGIMLGVFVLGLAGIPPFAGFMVKFWIFQALIEQSQIGVALLCVLGSIIGVAYYLRILMLLFMASPQEEGAAASWKLLPDKLFSLRFVVACALIVTLIGGLLPQFYADWILATIAIK